MILTEEDIERFDEAFEEWGDFPEIRRRKEQRSEKALSKGVMIVDDEWIEKQQTALGGELVPPEYRRYVSRDEIAKLPRGLRIYQGVRGGLFFDAREYKRLTGREPEIGERRVEGAGRGCPRVSLPHVPDPEGSSG